MEKRINALLNVDYIYMEIVPILDMLYQEHFISILSKEEFEQAMKEEIEKSFVLYENGDYSDYLTFFNDYLLIMIDSLKASLEENENLSQKGCIVNNVRTYLKQFSFNVALTDQELFLSLASGNENARNQLVEKYFLLVVHIAQKYYNSSLDIFDLIQNGSIGLLKAIDSFDITKGYQFSSYAVPTIEGYVKNCITQSVKHSSWNAQWNLMKYEKYENLLVQKLGRKPTTFEMAEELGMDTNEVTDLLKCLYTTVSLNQMNEDSEDSSIDDHLSVEEISLEDSVIKKCLPEDIQNLFVNCDLKQREIDVLTMYYGLDGKVSMDFPEIAKIFGVTRQRVHQIKQTAVRKLRNSELIRSFADYMDDPNKALKYIDSCKKR